MKRLSMARGRQAPASSKATKKPESADRVRAQCTTRYDAVRLRRLQELR
jgi:hypothetical protein